MTEKPKPIGYWVFGIIARNELVHWGKDDDTEFPYTDKHEAEQQAAYLMEQTPEDTHYVMTIFDNGQILAEETW